MKGKIQIGFHSETACSKSNLGFQLKVGIANYVAASVGRGNFDKNVLYIHILHTHHTPHTHKYV